MYDNEGEDLACSVFLLILGAVTCYFIVLYN